MADHSAIEWTDATFNPWIGCTKVSPACDHCYAAVSTPTRTMGVTWGAGAPRHRTSASSWQAPLRWNRGHDLFFAKHGRRRRVFCASLADVFDNEVPATWRMDLFALIAQTPNLDWLLLTKRIGNVSKMCSDDGLMFDLLAERVWIGATIANQSEADRDIPKLLGVPARVRFLSMEPLLGPVDLTSVEWPNLGGHRVDVLRAGYWNEAGCLALGPSAELGKPRGGFTNHSDMERIDWVIAGGESGPGARPMHPDWARSLRDQCQAASVPFFFKQWGQWGQYVNEEHYTHCGAERQPHAWVDRDTAVSGHCWLVDDDGGWSNWTGEPPMRADDQVLDRVAIMGKFGKREAGRLLDGVEHNAYPGA